jgi:hypothetical protein
MTEPLNPDTLALLDHALEGRHLSPNVLIPRFKLAALLAVARDHARLTAGIAEALEWTDSGGECGQRLYNLLSAEAGDTDVTSPDVRSPNARDVARELLRNFIEAKDTPSGPGSPYDQPEHLAAWALLDHLAAHPYVLSAEMETWAFIRGVDSVSAEAGDTDG